MAGTIGSLHSGHRTTATGGRWLVGCCAVVAALAAATELYAHLALRTSSPEAGATLLATPDRLRLEFTEPVELPLSSLVLTGPDGVAVALGPLLGGERPEVIEASILGRLAAGGYRVGWQAVGRDGHPVRGEFGFEIDEDAAGLPLLQEGPAEVDTVAAPPPTTPPPAPTFSSQSPLYAGVRWLTYLGILATIGAIGFSLLPRLPGSGGLSADTRVQANRGAAGVGLLGVAVLLVAVPLRLQAQSHAIFGAGITAERFSLLLGSIWGIAWVVQIAGAVAALMGLLLARRGRPSGWVLAGVGVLALVIAPAMSGHAAAVEPSPTLAVLSDAVHILAAGTWLGTLLVILLVGVPLARRQGGAAGATALARLVHAFSPVAMAAAGVVVLTGLFASTLHLTAVPDLWGTGYGRLLSAKLFLVVIVLALGAFNWRRTRLRLGRPGAENDLLRSGGAEVVGTALVIALTAILVAVPPPAHSAPPADTAVGAVVQP